MIPAEKAFLEQLSQIQTHEVGFMLGQLQKYPTTEELLTDFSYNLISRIMELIDGYGPEHARYELTDIIADQVISGNLHDCCEEFLKSTNH